jgi:hypothetical protein
MTGVAEAPGSEYLRGMRAAVLLLTGCTLPSSDPHPREQSKPADQSLPGADTALPVEDTAPSATGVTATPHIELDPTSTDFGSVPIGRYTVQPISIKNVGHADLEIDSVLFMPSDPSDLTMEPIETPLVVPSGEMRVVTIQFAPTDEGKDQSVLTVQSNDSNAPTVHAELHGTGVADADTGT